MNGFFPSAASSPFRELSRLQEYLDGWFQPEVSSIRARAGQGFPVINVGSTPDTVEVMALAPAIDPARLQLTIDKGLLVIAGERASALPAGREGASVYASERFSGSFRRVISLPDDIDPAKVDASYRDGILRVTLHKRESSKPRRIDVN